MAMKNRCAGGCLDSDQLQSGIVEKALIFKVLIPLLKIFIANATPALLLSDNRLATT
jgi:hypothetical protein